MNHLTHRSGFLQMLMSVALCLCAFGADAASGIVKAGSSPDSPTKKLSVPTPKASKKQNSYVKLKWKQVSGAEGYYVFRGTSTSWNDASYLTKITSRLTTVHYDYTATPGTKYHYWVCPYASGYYHYNTSKYATGMRKMLAVPTPKASKKQTAYVKVSWKKVSGAEGYYVFRGTSTSWSQAVKIRELAGGNTRVFYDYSATAGVKYIYWVCPYAGGYYYNNTGKYATGMRKAQSTPTTPTTPTTQSGFYFSDYGGSRLGTSISISVGGSKTICLRNSSGQAVGAVWYKSNGNLSDNRASVSESVMYLQIRGMTPGTTTLTATYNNRSYTLSVTIGGGSSGNGYLISGSSSLRYGASARYSLYHNGQRLTGVTWSVNAYLRTVSVSSGILTVTPSSRPVSSNKSAVHAYVNGSRVASKQITITQ